MKTAADVRREHEQGVGLSAAAVKQSLKRARMSRQKKERLERKAILTKARREREAAVAERNAPVDGLTDEHSKMQWQYGRRG